MRFVAIVVLFLTALWSSAYSQHLWKNSGSISHPTYSVKTLKPENTAVSSCYHRCVSKQARCSVACGEDQECIDNCIQEGDDCRNECGN